VLLKNILNKSSKIIALFFLVGHALSYGGASDRLSDTGVANYVHTGDYNRALVHQLTLARDYLDLRVNLNKRRGVHKKLAIVAAIDNTALAHEPRLKKLFVHPPMRYIELWPSDEPVIWAFRAFYDYAVAQGIQVFFVTSRLESERENITHNLQREGYVGWQALMMRPTASTISVAEQKTRDREKIEKQGYSIVLNISSKLDDLQGEHSSKVVLLPEPDSHRFRSLKGLNRLS
jgi:predicted secreted acid phosphatase